MSGKPKLRRGARVFRGHSEEGSGSGGLGSVLPKHRDPDSHGLTQSRKIVISTVSLVTLLLIGLGNHMWLQETEFPRRSSHLYAIMAEYGSRLSNYQEMSNLVNYILKKLREDQVQRADYALKSAGASIIEAGTSESYKNNKAKLYWHGIRFLTYEMPPDIILQPDVHPGKCWAFPGSQGHALIKLARKITPTAVTMEHISQTVSPSGNISSAPKEFSVYGILKHCEGEEIFLGQFVYNRTGTTVQTFELQHEVSESLLCVKLKILSNWGHQKYTCLYRFRVHGTPGEYP
ncbi:SUN domain-containing protein 3 isoform X4 [Suricata suricatta]|uniref:SUN domain-containing protein 3 isoform X4 n=1 Tax=Suricata suricatta TaxID=37032 RepID=UPI0011553D83|nr:SUN domain-containing protein 3 isoform X4 [Suricata suricatta]